MPEYEVDRERAQEHGLTEREMEVLCLVCGGLGSKEAGARLGMKDATARYHMMNARHKLGAANNSDVCLRALDLGIIRRLA